MQAFLLKAFYARLKAAEARLWEMRHLSVGGRLARLLLGLAQGGEIPFSHQDLARMVGATRETVTKLLGEWALEAGWSWATAGWRSWTPRPLPAWRRRFRL